MNGHFSKRFDSDLMGLWQKMVALVKSTDTQLGYICSYLQQPSAPEGLLEVKKIEKTVDEQQTAIDDECIRLMATRAPVAIDLRYLAMMNRVANDVERISDELNKTARLLLQWPAAELKPLWRTLIATAELAQTMLKGVLLFLAETTIDDAMRVIGQDQALNQNYKQVIAELTQAMSADAGAIPQGVGALFVAKALERVGDHCVNIGEAFIFYDQACDLRHKSLDEKNAEIQHSH